VPKAEKPCPICGTVFMGNSHKMFCSKNCQLEGCHKRNVDNYVKTPIRRVCDSCKKEFIAKQQWVKFCHEPGCPSALFKGNKNVVQTYKAKGRVSAKEVCKIVICSKIDEIRDLLFGHFNEMDNVDHRAAFNEMRRIYLMKHMHTITSRVAVAAALFYLVSNRSIAQMKIVRFLREKNERRNHASGATIRDCMKKALEDPAIKEVLSRLALHDSDICI